MSAFFVAHPGETDLALFAGGELGPLSRWRIERHIEGCERCRSDVSDYFRLQGELNELAETPELDWTSFRQSIHNEVTAARAEERVATSSRGWVWQFGLAAASVVCAIAVWNDWRAPSQPTTVASRAAPQAEATLKEVETVSEEKASAELEQLAEVIAPSIAENALVAPKQRQKAEAAPTVPASAPAMQFSDRLVADSAAPPPPTAPYEVRAQALVESHEADALGQAISADLRDEAAPMARRVNAQLDETSDLRSQTSDLRSRLKTILAQEGPEAVRLALERGGSAGTRQRSDSEVDQAEGERLLRMLDSNGLEAVIEDLKAR